MRTSSRPDRGRARNCSRRRRRAIDVDSTGARTSRSEMPQYMIMIVADAAQQRSPAQLRAFVEGRAAFEQTLRAAGTFREGERLRPASEARRVRVRDGATQIEAGPFEDASLDGYFIVGTESLDAALAIAGACPLPPGATLEVRPVARGFLEPERSHRQGRTFAFAVLGNAPTERAWIETMDRIDAASRFPDDRWAGGVRLQEPARGRVVKSVGGHRTHFDGPFLESKEVIGGLFFLRTFTLEE